MELQDVANFLKEAGTYYLATVEGDQPRVRPFGTASIIDGKLTFQTGLTKEVAKQMIANPKVELCGVVGDKWIRVSGTVEKDDSVEACTKMLDEYPELKSMYAAGDGNCTLFKFTGGNATISSFTEEPQTLKF